ncbi:WecB/TagA/CpsF family glycosyltransferase [Rhodopirellula sp. MGV]|uniref:WecB/TagA/CpsF family glycosyltransferase n=1 Tax=Rhodopirellula sp. MGV TaxID=2023130 RepID=UPI000B979D49|nr:WecB/TagA/CpsF family glycosyltransferase [Rhodopirellula sp. MGV]OYP37014.1 glycosyltransferase [Rhodopirellula sp. MGV]PNY36223.1 glycosyltransferase [Rhodopirellula baltica]
MIDQGKRNILGIGVNAIDYQAAVANVIEAAKQRRPFTVTALAVHGVMTGVGDNEHRHRLSDFDLVCPDGQPVRWALNWLHRCELSDRVYGPELTLRLCAAAADEGVSVFLFGATDEMLNRFAETLQRKFPGLKIAGMKASQFRTLSESETDALADEINSSGAGICFVGLGCPRQEVFAFEMKDKIQMPQIAVGAAFAFHAGLLSQAPPWMQRRGLEWLYRLVCEPRRLWKRYLTTNPAFVCHLGLQKLGILHRMQERGVQPSQSVRYG